MLFSQSSLTGCAVRFAQLSNAILYENFIENEVKESKSEWVRTKWMSERFSRRKWAAWKVKH